MFVFRSDVYMLLLITNVRLSLFFCMRPIEIVRLFNKIVINFNSKFEEQKKKKQEKKKKKLQCTQRKIHTTPSSVGWVSSEHRRILSYRQAIEPETAPSSKQRVYI